MASDSVPYSRVGVAKTSEAPPLDEPKVGNRNGAAVDIAPEAREDTQ